MKEVRQEFILHDFSFVKCKLIYLYWWKRRWDILKGHDKLLVVVIFIILIVVIVLCVHVLNILELYNLLNVCSLCYINYISIKLFIKLTSVKQKVEDDVLGTFLMLLIFHQQDCHLHCLYPSLALFLCRKIANFNPDFLFESLLNLQCIYFKQTNCFRVTLWQPIPKKDLAVTMKPSSLFQIPGKQV